MSGIQEENRIYMEKRTWASQAGDSLSKGRRPGRAAGHGVREPAGSGAPGAGGGGARLRS